MKFRLWTGAAIAMLTLIAGCATTAPSEVSKVALVDLTARTTGADSDSIEVSNIEVGRNYSVVPPPEIYMWTAKTPEGTYNCKTANGYNMTGGNVNEGGCTRIE